MSGRLRDELGSSTHVDPAKILVGRGDCESNVDNAGSPRREAEGVRAEAERAAKVGGAGAAVHTKDE